MYADVCVVQGKNVKMLERESGARVQILTDDNMEEVARLGVDVQKVCFLLRTLCSGFQL